MKKLIALLLFFATFLHSYDSDDALKVSILEKAIQFMTFKDKNEAIIAIYNNSYGDAFEKTFAGKQINNKNIKIKYIDNIDKLEGATVLYISNVASDTLGLILKKANNKGILTVSDARGFTEKGGAMQIFIASQKPKLKINLDTAHKEDIKIKATLLRIAEVTKEDNK